MKKKQTKHAAAKTVMQEDDDELSDMAPQKLREAIKHAEATVNAYAIGQSEVVRTLVLTILSREHAILVGPWGCNKTGIINMLMHMLGCTDMAFFATLDKFTPPETLLGMFSPRALKDEDKWLRNTKGKLPEAHFAFIGEVFRGNSAVRASLHTILNERYIENDGQRVNVPLLSMFCDSNSFPCREEDMPFYDRLLWRYHVGYLAGNDRNGFCKMMQLGTKPFSKSKNVPCCTLAGIEAAQNSVMNVDVPINMFELLNEARCTLLSKGLVISNRRWTKCTKALQASAWLLGRDYVTVRDFSVLSNVLWSLPEDVQKVDEVLNSYSAQNVEDKENEILQTARELFEKGMEDENGESLSDVLVTLAEMTDKLVSEQARDVMADYQRKLEEKIMGDGQ